MPADKIHARLITQHHLFDCMVATEGQRLQDLLNANMTTYLKVYEATVYRLADLQMAVATFKRATVLISHVNLVLLPDDGYEAPQRRMYAYIAKHDYRSFLTVAHFDVDGKMHFTTAPDAVSFLAVTAKIFFPVTQAVINSAAAVNAEPLMSPVAFVRREAVSFLHFGEPE